MPLAVLLDTVSEAAKPPIFALADFTATFGQGRGDLFRDGFNLLLRDVIACDEHAFVKRHVHSLWMAQPWPRDGARIGA